MVTTRMETTLGSTHMHLMAREIWATVGNKISLVNPCIAMYLTPFLCWSLLSHGPTSSAAMAMGASICQERRQGCFHLFMPSAHPAEHMVCWTCVQHAYRLFVMCLPAWLRVPVSLHMHVLICGHRLYYALSHSGDSRVHKTSLSSPCALAQTRPTMSSICQVQHWF